MSRDIEKHSGSWQGFMVQRLKLKGNDLMVYGIIHQYSYQGEMGYYGSLSYLCEITGATKKGIYKNLQSLEKKGLIKKTVIYIENVRRCVYQAVVTIDNYENYEMQDDHVVCISEENNSGVLSTPGGCTEYTGGGVLSTPKYKYKYKYKNTSKKDPHHPSGNTGEKETYNDIMKSRNLSPEVEALVIEFIKMRKLINKPISNQGLKIILTRLEKIFHSEEEKIQILENAIVNNKISLEVLNNNGSRPKVVNGFHNFEERKNNYDELERKLLL